VSQRMSKITSGGAAITREAETIRGAMVSILRGEVVVFSTEAAT